MIFTRISLIILSTHPLHLLVSYKPRPHSPLQVYGTPEKPIAIGSCKANIGHMESAATMASIYKAVLMVENREFYAQVNRRT